MRKLPPYPVVPPTFEKHTVWIVYRDMWFAVRSFDNIEDARHFSATQKAPRLITSHRTQSESTATEVR